MVFSSRFSGTAVWSFILYLLKPDLKIGLPLIEKFKKKKDDVDATGIGLKLPIINAGVFNALNLKIEVCIVQKGEF